MPASHDPRVEPEDDGERAYVIRQARWYYARAGTAEFWIVDLTTDTVLVLGDPDGDGHRSVTLVRPPTVLDVRALTGVGVPAGAIFV